MTLGKVFERITRAIWSWRQPLTRRPNSSLAPISDLFVWRNSGDWETSFELIDMPGLFLEGERRLKTHVFLCLFDRDGSEFFRKRLEIFPGRRNTVNLANFLNKTNGEIGTFSIFHNFIPPTLELLDSYIAERGYVSYRYRNAPLRVYVHGNLDAVSMGSDGKLESLGSSGLLRRQYCLQYELRPEIAYEIGLVNPTSAEQKCVCKLISVKGGKIVGHKTMNLLPRAVQLFSIPTSSSDSVRLVIESHMIMARPLVFSIQNFKADVFHG